MVCPILISVSLVPGPYCFWASAGWASRVSAAATRSVCRTDILVSSAFFVVAGSVSKHLRLGKPMRSSPQRNAGGSGRGGLGGLGRLLGFVRFDVDGFSLRHRPDAQRPSGVRRGLGLRGP